MGLTIRRASELTRDLSVYDQKYRLYNYNISVKLNPLDTQYYRSASNKTSKRRGL